MRTSPRSPVALLPRACAVAALASLVSACGDDRAPADDAPRGGARAWRELQLGGPLADDVNDVAVVGSLTLVAGFCDGTLADGIEPGGDARGFVTAYLPGGEALWERVLDTPGADAIEALALRPGALALVGRTSGAVPGARAGGQHDAVVARVPLDGAGAPALGDVVQLGDARPQHPTRIAHDGADALVIAGYDDVFVEGGAVIDWENPSWARVAASAEGLVVDYARRDATGVPDVALGLAVGADGAVFLGGNVSAGPQAGAFVRRLAPDGTSAWARRLSPVSADAVTALALGPDGLLYAAGATFLDLGGPSAGQQDVFVLALDPATGATVRAWQAGSADSDYPRDLAIAADGAIWVAGETLGSLPGATLAGEVDLMVLRLAPDGAWAAWQRGTPGDDTARAIALADDGAVIGGYTTGALAAGGAHAGGRDGVVLRIDEAELTAP